MRYLGTFWSDLGFYGRCRKGLNYCNFKDLEPQATSACKLLTTSMILGHKCVIIPLLIGSIFAFDPFAPLRAQTPVLEVQLEQDTARVDEPYRVMYETSWTGSADLFAVLSAEPETVAWASSRVVETKTRQEDGKFFITQTIEYVPFKAGEFEISPFTVSYFDPALLEDSGDATEEEESPELPAPQTLEAGAFQLTVRPNLAPYYFYGTIAVAVALCTGVAFTSVRRRRALRAAGATIEVPEPQTVQSALNLARQHRLDGKYYEFYTELTRAASLMAPSTAARALRGKLDAAAKEVGYKGIRPSDDEMDGVLKEVEQAVQQGPCEDA